VCLPGVCKNIQSYKVTAGIAKFYPPLQDAHAGIGMIVDLMLQAGDPLLATSCCFTLNPNLVNPTEVSCGTESYGGTNA